MAIQEALTKRRRGRPTKAEAAARKAIEKLMPQKPTPKKRVKAEKPESTQPKLSMDDPKFFSKLGARGGKANFERNGSEFFRAIAVKSHQVRRERAAEAKRLLEEAKLRVLLGRR
jgi:hypothetical protein